MMRETELSTQPYSTDPSMPYTICLDPGAEEASPAAVNGAPGSTLV